MNELPEIPPLRTHTTEEGETLFSIVSIIEAMEVSTNPRRYWSDLKRKLKREGFEVYENIVQLKLESTDGKKYKTDVANRETVLRILQSISHPSAEQAKQWLARMGEERFQEVEDPMKAIERAKDHYRQKGYNDKWIETRIQSKQIRDILTDEWQNRGVTDKREYGALTNEIHKGAFDMTVRQHKGMKELKRQNLRDHMTLTELAITILGEASTVDIARSRDAKGYDENKDAARDGGTIAGNARREIEAQTGKKVASSTNFLKRLKGKKKEKD